MRFVTITDHTVNALYGRGSQNVFSFPPGEKYKTRETKEWLEDLLLESGFTRDTVITGLGGGVVTDMAGYLAATFCRGVPLVLIPTTLVAMVDAAIGGKNGVNTPLGKNMIGTIYHPHKVIIDTRFLATLPDKEKKNGEVEIMKIGLIADPSLLKSKSIPGAIEAKRRLIARDDKEAGLRRLLNLGHTIGHALEHLSAYEMSHGEAVSLGIRIECQIAYRMGLLNRHDWQIIQNLFPKQEIPYSHQAFREALILDKKSQRGVPRFVLLKEMGQPHFFDGEYCSSVPEAILSEVLDEYVVCSCSKS
jgi:3-dehydroquinate synthase